MLDGFALAKRIVTGDALYCQRAFCRRVVEGQGAYFFAVGENQPRLHDDLFWLFEWPAPGEAFATAVEHRQHGDRVETRRLWASSALEGYSDWPGLRQACKVERRVRCRGGSASRRPTRSPAWGRRSGRPSCWRSGGGTGRSRTGCTTCGT